MERQLALRIFIVIAFFALAVNAQQPAPPAGSTIRGRVIYAVTMSGAFMTTIYCPALMLLRMNSPRRLVLVVAA